MDLGEVTEVEETGDGVRLHVRTTLTPEVSPGDSVAINGVCLTATRVDDEAFAADVMHETLDRSSLGAAREGARVNVELPLRASDRLGGHVVLGHVDGVGTVTGVRQEGEGWWITIEPPFDLMRYFVEKGSVCIDGVSLTIANVAYSRFSVALIPHTRAVTTANEWQEGVQVNLEVDVIAKYVERLTQWSAAGSQM